MSDLISESQEALSWIRLETSKLVKDSIFNKIIPGTIWYHDEQVGAPIGGEDPSSYIDQINTSGWPLFREHDPGLPAGRIIRAAPFYEFQ